MITPIVDPTATLDDVGNPGTGGAHAAAGAPPSSPPVIAPEGTLPGRDLSDTDHDYLVGEGIAAEYVDARAAAGLLRSVTDPTDPLPAGFDYDWLTSEHRPGILFGVEGATGNVIWLLRPWNPHPGKGKYVGAFGVAGWGLYQQGATAGPVLIVEGTKQALAAAAAVADTSTTPDGLTDAAVLGIQGCWGWGSSGVIHPGLVNACRGREVVIILDADAGSNRKVYDAGEGLKDALAGVAQSINFIWLPGRGTEGLDDLLALEEPADRRRRMCDLYAGRQPKPAKRRPSDKSGAGNGSFEVWDPMTGKLRVLDTAHHLLTTQHYALTASEQLAAFVNGRYVVAKQQLPADVLALMGNTFTKPHLANIGSALEALAHAGDHRLPEFTAEPTVCFLNGLLDLRTMAFTPHSPDYLSTRQIPVNWDPNAAADRWEAWAVERMGALQLEVLEEVLSQMLDPSTAPSKALILYGPKRTGKSTVGRIAAIIAGGRKFVSAVPIQQLSNMRYAAMVYQKVLNVCADLPREAVQDESGFLAFLGGDAIAADEKYGNTFDFMNTALHLFATNTIPTVTGETAAYLDRIVAIAMIRSFADRANPAVEDAIMEQLPGICVRLAHAAHRRYQRKTRNAAEAAAGVPESQRTPIWTPGHPAVTQRFADASDRIQRFVNTCCNTGVTQAPSGRSPGDVYNASQPGPATKSKLFEAFTAWTELEKAPGMGMRAFTERLLKIPGVRQIRLSDKTRALNLEIRPQDDWDTFSDDSDLLPLLFPEAYGGQPTEAPTTPPVETPVPAPPPGPAPTPAPPAPPSPPAHPFSTDELTSLQMLTPMVYGLLAQAAVVAPGVAAQTVAAATPAGVLLTDLAAVSGMTADRLRGLIRRLDPLLRQGGWLIRERRLREPGELASAAAPKFGDDDFGADRVGYVVVRTTATCDPHALVAAR